MTNAASTRQVKQETLEPCHASNGVCTMNAREIGFPDGSQVLHKKNKVRRSLHTDTTDLLKVDTQVGDVLPNLSRTIKMGLRSQMSKQAVTSRIVVLLGSKSSGSSTKPANTDIF
jgi:hypothetical protein